MVYVVSDIHGHYEKLLALLDLIKFNESDTLYILGDIIDRGPNILKTVRKVMTTPNIKMILGNHEDMFLRYFHSGNWEDKSLWFNNGGGYTDLEFSDLCLEEKLEIVDFFESLPIEYHIDINDSKFMLVHGNYVPQKVKKYFTKEEYRTYILWNRVRFFDTGPEDCKVIFGHTPTYKYYGTEKQLKIWKNGNMIGIDCGLAAYYHYPEIVRLGCLCLNTMEEFYV